MSVFEWATIPELNFEMESVTTEAGRVYVTPDGESYPSITTVLSNYNKKGIEEWRARVGQEEANRVSRLASGRGSKLHTLCEDYLQNKVTPQQIRMKAMPDVRSMFFKLKPMIDAKIGKIITIEQPLYSKKLRIAGRVDCIAEWGGVLSVIDWKTSSRPKEEHHIRNYFMQCAAYCEMFEYVTGRPIEQIVVAIAVADGEEPQFFVRNKKHYLSDLQKEIDKHYRNIEPKPLY